MNINLPNLATLNFIQSISPDDWMAKNQSPLWYFRRGYSALCMITYECQRNHVKPLHILDFGCGHGCVSRMLKAQYPNATLVGQDINEEWMEWCSTNLKIRTVLSPKNIEDVILPKNQYDLIWAGSVFSHMSESSSTHLLGQFKSALSDNGIAIFSTAGQIMRNGYKPGKMRFLTDEEIISMREDFDNDNYAFYKYNNSDIDNWGHSLIPYTWVINKCKELNLPLTGFYEGGWGLVQDIYTLRKSVTSYSWP